MGFIERIRIAVIKQLRPYDRQGAQLWQSHCRLRRDILQFYKTHPTDDKEILEALDYLNHRLDTVFFPAAFREKYEYRQICLDFDGDGTPSWLTPEGRRLFFLKDSPDNVRRSLNGLRIEQDEKSPHRYLVPDFDIREGDVLADVGSAEGILTLGQIEKVSRAYLFESDPAWIEVLEKTFAPWKDKVTIVKGFVSDKDGEGTIRLDSFFEKEGVRPDFVKLDVEGHELQVLQGMEGLLQKGSGMRIAACCYHLQGEHEEIVKYAESRGYNYETSQGVMLFGLYDEQKPPYFRKGLVRIKI